MSVTLKLSNVINYIRASISDDYVENLRKSLFDVATSLSEIKATLAEEAPAPAPARVEPRGELRFRIVMKMAPGETYPREVYCLDGMVTESKIYGIKYLRSVSHMGLKEAKDYLEALPARYTGDFNALAFHDEPRF